MHMTINYFINITLGYRHTGGVSREGGREREKEEEENGGGVAYTCKVDHRNNKPLHRTIKPSDY